jgi:eukaryotic-like serine/threonine-protein kinase
MGEIYLAHDTTLNRYVAIKLLPRRFTSDEDRLRRFKQEAQIASLINHPNVLTIHGVGEENGAHYMVTEYIDGDTLRERMRHGPLPVIDAVRITLGVAEALNAAHEYWVIHRDIKPENVMLRRDGYVKVVDFGLAKLSEQMLMGEKSGGRVDTTPGMVPGSVTYVAPERLRGEAADPRADLFSLGVMAYEMLVGEPPFNGKTIFLVLNAILKAEPPPLLPRASGVPEELDRVISRLLKKQPAERYQKSSELVSELAAIQQELLFEQSYRRRLGPPPEQP